MNSYQRLKKKIKDEQEKYRKLLIDFRKVVEDPESNESIEISTRIRMEADSERILMMGVSKGYNMMGLLEQISKSNPTDTGTYSWNITDRSRDGKVQ